MKSILFAIQSVVLATVLLMSLCNMHIYAQSVRTPECGETELQQYAEWIMTGKTGALVVVVPSTGKVLCMVSTAGRPMEDFSSDLSGYNAMGSAFNSAIVLACLKDSIITSETRLPCNHGFIKDGCRIMGCHDGIANWALDEAIATSCKGYFGGCRDMFLNSTKYKNHRAVRARMCELMKSLGFGKGITSDSDKIEANPLAMANFAAIIANRGNYPVSLENTNMQKVIIDSIHFEAVIRGMRKAVESGTVFRTGNMDAEGIELCGATGTMVNPHGKNFTAFMGFAPMRNPEIAIYCVVENEESGSVLSVPIATLVIEKYINGHISDRRKWLEEKVR